MERPKYRCIVGLGAGAGYLQWGRSHLHCAAAHSTGGGRMNNLEIVEILEIAVIGIAVAQALTILLTFRRERDIKELRELVDEQRLRIVELRAWLAGRNSFQPSRIKSEREPVSEPIANIIKASEPAIAPKDLSEAIQPRTVEDEAAQSGHADFGGSRPSGQAQWPIEELQRHVARLKAGAPSQPAIPVKEPEIMRKDLLDTIPPSTTGDELGRATKAINWLKDDAEKAREIGASLHDPPAEKKVG